ncbi:MAG: hypothetical protein C4294_13050, partial [Nitrospiraceae bacterium]
LETASLHDHVVICGFGRVGSAIGTTLDCFGIPYAVIDLDIDRIVSLRGRTVAALYGDASHRELLLKAGIERALLVIVALPEIEAAELAVRRLRTMNPNVPVLARAHGDREANASCLQARPRSSSPRSRLPPRSSGTR